MLWVVLRTALGPWTRCLRSCGWHISPLDPALCSGSTPTTVHDVAGVETGFLGFRFLGESDLAACRGRLSLLLKRHPHSAERQAACTCSSREAPALWKCRACGRPADVLLHPTVSTSGIHRPLGNLAGERCRLLPAAELRDSHTPTGNDDDGVEDIFRQTALFLCKGLDSLSRGRRLVSSQAARNAPLTASAAGRLRRVGCRSFSVSVRSGGRLRGA